jgi:hypothetical protein
MDSVHPNPKRTGAGNHLHNENLNGSGDFEVPKVDMQKAAEFRPSRVSGKHVMWLVTFVAGMGVRSAYELTVFADSNSSPCSDTIKVSLVVC